MHLMAVQQTLLALFLISLCSQTSSRLNSLTKGSSLSVENSDHILISPNAIFSAGFYSVGDNAFGFAIWFTEPSCDNNCTVVWMANRDSPVNGKRSKLSLLKSGNLILTDAGKFNIWSTGTASLSSPELHLKDSGNLVLSSSGDVLWQSFDSPTDTLLPLQHLTRDAPLVSSRTLTNHSSGFHRLFFDNDNVLRLLYDGPDASSIYWPDPELLSWEAGRSIYNNTRTAVLDSLGNFTSSDGFTFLSSDYGKNIQRTLRLDIDGNIRLYGREEKNGTWVVSWQALSQPCWIHGVCGPHSVCSYSPSSGRKCSCVPGYKMINNSDWSLGCEPEFKLSCNESEADFLKIPRVVFFGYDYGFYPNYTFEKCKNLCLQLCECKGFEFKFDKHHMGDGIYCLPKTRLLNGHNLPNVPRDHYLKLPKTSLSLYNKSVQQPSQPNCSNKVITQLNRTYPRNHENSSLKFMLSFAIAVGGVEIICILLAWFLLNRAHHQSDAKMQGYLVAATGFQNFTYSELKKATKCFGEEIGRGAGGIVYKGVLSDGRIAAIKRLYDANQGEAEFLAEVSTIGRLNHMNLIEMWGYCAKGKHRLLVYEYMEHGSLAQNLSSKALDAEKRFEIAVGTAKGLAYLHEECLEWVLHCDVKPQNILLDSNYQPKVSDFGLSRLLNRGDLNDWSFSRIRGTRGYMAPEWVFKLPITSKVDVYSYGIVVLEMVTGKNPAGGVQAVDDGGDSESRRLESWVKDKVNEGIEVELWSKEIIDPELEGKYDKGKMEILVEVAMKCVKEDKDARPTMSQVVEMLLRHENDH